MVKSEKSGAPVAFTTKTGQTVSFGAKGGKSEKAKKIRVLESRIKLIEKSLAVAEKEKAKNQAKLAKQAEKDALRIAKTTKPKVIQGIQQTDKARVGKKTTIGKSKASVKGVSDDKGRGKAKTEKDVK